MTLRNVSKAFTMERPDGCFSLVLLSIFVVHSPNRYIATAILLCLFAYQLTRTSIFSLGWYSRTVWFGLMGAFICGALSFLFHYSSFNNLFWFLFGVFPFLVGPILLGLSSLLQIEKALKAFVVIEAFVLLFQYLVQVVKCKTINVFAVSAGVGDLLSGTLFGFSSPLAISMLIVSLSFLGLFFHFKEKKYLAWSAFAGFLSLLPGMMSGVAMFFLGFITYLLLELLKSIFHMRFTKLSIVLFVVFSTMFGALVLFQGKNVNYAGKIFTLMMRAQPPVKVLTIRSTIEMYEKYPTLIFSGVGLGNYTSRASMIVSGEYLEHQPAFIPITTSIYAKKYILPYWNRGMYNKVVGGSIGNSMINEPFNFHLSLLAECGIFGFLFAIGSMIFAVGRSILNGFQVATVFLLFSLYLWATNDWLAYPSYGIMFCIFLRMIDLIQLKKTLPLMKE